MKSAGECAGIAAAAAAKFDGYSLIVGEGCIAPNRMCSSRHFAREDNGAEGGEVAAEFFIRGDLGLVNIGHHLALANAGYNSIIRDPHRGLDDDSGLPHVAKFRLAFHGASPVHQKVAVDEDCIR